MILNDAQLQQFDAVNRELNALEAARALTKVDYERLLASARAAVGSYTPALEGILSRGVRLGFIQQ